MVGKTGIKNNIKHNEKILWNTKFCLKEKICMASFSVF